MADSFAKKIYEKMGKMVSAELTGGIYGEKAYSHIYLDMKDNFIDGKYPERCDIKGNLFEKNEKERKLIKYHEGAAHMNSSQVACISFFKKFFECEEWEQYLVIALREIGVPLKSETIKNAVFEYIPDTKEKTNFDFYLEMEGGTHVSMEIKYTESEFGGLTPEKRKLQKYKDKWEKIYKEYVGKSTYLNCSEDEFYMNYQINRNICLAKDGDVVLFLTPLANNSPELASGREYINSINAQHPEISNIFWEELVNKVLELIKDEPELLAYYTKFKQKYIDVLSD